MTMLVRFEDVSTMNLISQPLTAQEFEVPTPNDQWILSHNVEMESSSHYMQLLLLVSCLEWLWHDRQDYFIGADLTIYFSPEQVRTKDFRGPDFFLVKDVEKRPRASWVIWNEDGRYPNLIIELLSDSTAKSDRTVKKTLYQDRFRTPEYFWFSPNTLEFEGFWLDDDRYEAIVPNAQGWRWSQELELYLGIQDEKLRFFDATGQLVPTPEESAIQFQKQVEQEVQRAEQETQRAEQAAQRAERETQRAERLAAQLRALGIEPQLDQDDR